MAIWSKHCDETKQMALWQPGQNTVMKQSKWLYGDLIKILWWSKANGSMAIWSKHCDETNKWLNRDLIKNTVIKQNKWLYGGLIKTLHCDETKQTAQLRADQNTDETKQMAQGRSDQNTDETKQMAQGRSDQNTLMKQSKRLYGDLIKTLF